MNLIDSLLYHRQEKGVSQNIPITHLVAPDVFETQEGHLGAVLKIKGVPYLTVDDEQLKAFQAIIHHCILQMDAEFMVMETVHRRFESTQLSQNDFRHDFCKTVHDKYHQRFSDGLYVNDLYLVLLYKGDKSRTNKKGLMNRLLSTSNQLLDQTIVNARMKAREQSIRMLNQKVNQWIASLSRFGVMRLGDNDYQGNSLLSYLSLVPNAGRAINLATAKTYPVHANTMQAIQNAHDHYPEGHLGQYLANHRLFFGEMIQFQGNTKQDTLFGVMLSIKTYSPNTKNQSLDSLLALDCEFIRTQSFAPLDTAPAIKTIEVAHGKKVNAEDYAASQIEALAELADFIASEKASLGLHHHTLMLIGKTKEALESAINRAMQAYAKSNLTIVRETIGQPISFFAQIPGNARFIARATPISSENFADFCSLHNTQNGYREGCLLGEPITLVQTPEKTPVFWNYHKPGSANNPSSGHTLIIGSNGSGKTALACFLDSEMNRFNGHQTFLLDRNESAKIYILACDGIYMKLSPGSSHEFTMNPLQLEDTEANRAFCKNWMASLLLEEGESSLNSEISGVINEVINYGYDHLAPKDRRLSTIAALLSIDFPRWPQLNRWLGASASKSAGEFAWAFDNENDSLAFNADKVGIDLTYLIDSAPSYISTPFYMYLLHRMMLSMTGHVTSIVIDEMWQVMKQPFWEKALEHYLPTIRKLFGHIVGMTQSPQTIANSPINHVLLDNHASLVLFTNPAAKPAVYKEELHLTDAEYRLIVSHATDSRKLLYKQNHESIFCDIDFSTIKKELRVLSGNINSVKQVDALRARLGSAACDWLPAFLEETSCA